MADHSTIEWTEATWNPITGCTLVSDGCRYCYAAELAATRLKNHPSRKGLSRRNAVGEAKFTGEVRLNEQWLDQPMRWSKPRKIFVCAHGDLFHESVPEDWIDRVFAVIALCPQHTFQVLTKRPERMRHYIERLSKRASVIARHVRTLPSATTHHHAGIAEANRRLTVSPLPNLWLGASAEDQITAVERTSVLEAIPAAVRFVSLEPLLGPVELDGLLEDVIEKYWREDPEMAEAIDAYRRDLDIEDPHRQKHRLGIDWVIVGGESGRSARPIHPSWVRTLRDECQVAGVPFFFKQWGRWLHEEMDPNGSNWDWAEAEDRGILHHWPDGTVSIPLHKRDTGRELDGREWSEMPR